MKPTSSPQRPPLAAKIVLERRVRPGHAAEFESWTRELIETAALSPAFQGSSVLSAGGSEYFILLRFDSPDGLRAWQSSEYVENLLRAGDELSNAMDAPVVRTGLETWFHLPGLSVPAAPPPKWKMAIVTWMALLPQVLLLARVIPPWVPFLIGAALSTAIPVVLLTWVVMPRLTRWLQRWLYAGARPIPTGAAAPARPG